MVPNPLTVFGLTSRRFRDRATRLRSRARRGATGTVRVVDTLVWYVSYGSNMCLDRLMCYLAGGRPAGGTRSYPGARDRRAPRESRGVCLPGGIYFAMESTVWGGGMAFYDERLPGRVAARAHLVTAGQFSDIAAQEMHRAPGVDLDMAAVVADGRASLGPGRYETLVCAGHLDGYPLLTFTRPGPLDAASLRPPSRAYLAMLVAGLREGHGWDDAAARSYLSGLPGLAPAPGSP